MMRQLDVGPLPDNALDAAAAFMALHLDTVRAILGEPDCSTLTIILPPAPYDHRDWRRAVARDLARGTAPKRVNIVAGRPGEARNAVLRFLADAFAVTGQYLVCHDHDRATDPISQA
jgi:hypothetical protein